MMGQWMRRVWSAMVDAVYPRGVGCLCCEEPSYGQPLCRDCREELERLRLGEPLCPLCGHPVAEGPCLFCRGEAPGKMRSVWRHAGAARTLVHRLKHDNVADAAQVLGEAMAEEARKLRVPDTALVTWVTMPDKRRRMRGIDHGRVLAEQTARALGLPCRCLLTRQAGGHTQQGLNREARLSNLRGKFACGESLHQPVVLVDDVMTTSATARVCAECLLKAGAASVLILTATQAGRSAQT